MIDPPRPPASSAPDGDTDDRWPDTRPLLPGMPASSGPGATGTRGRLHRLRDNLVLRLPATVRGAAVDPALRGTLALALVAVAGAALAVWFAWSGRPATLPGVATPSVSPAAPEAMASPAALRTGETAARPTGAHAGRPGEAGRAAPPTPPEAGEEIVVDVAGMVARPGVVTLPPGSRVVDALDAAGGVLPGTDTTGIGLARRLTDGEQVLVDGRPGPAPAPPPGGGGATGPASAPGTAGAGAPLDLNTATVEDFDGLPGVGPVLARRIVEWREAHGGFATADQLGEVTGIGDKRLAELLPLVTVR